MTASYAFIPAAGTNFNVGEEPEIAKRLDELAKELHKNIYGISGYRSPSQSAAVGGFSDDPHTKGQAADVGVNSESRASAAALTNAELAKVGLWRPFDLTGQNPAEINHVQILPQLGGPTVPGVTAPGKQGSNSDLLGNIFQGVAPAGLGNALAVGGDVAGVTGVNPVTKGAEEAGKVVAGLAGEAASGVAGEVASGLFGDLKAALGADFVKGLLYVVLAGGGAALIFTGVSRAAGMHPAQAAKKAAAVAAVGAAA